MMSIRLSLLVMCFWLLPATIAVAFSDSLGHWFTRAPLPTPRQEMPHAVLDEKIYVPGGATAGFTGSAVVEVFDPVTNTWDTIPRMPAARHHLGAAVASGKLYIIGGYAGSGFSARSDVWSYDPATSLWDTLQSLPVPTGAHVCVDFEEKIYCFGGVAAGAVTGNTLIYDPLLNQWNAGLPMPTPREHLAAAKLDSLIYVVGGRNFAGGPGNYKVVEAYSPATNTWYKIPDMPTARGGLAAASMNGRLYAFGGETPGVFPQNEEYDPSTNAWRPMAPMRTPRHGIGAATIGDTIFIIGGAPVEGVGVTNVNEGFTLAPITSVNNAWNSPADFRLYQNYPNPFNPMTRIRFTLHVPGFTTLKVYDMLGREVETLARGDFRAGEHEAIWDATYLRSGVYLYRLYSNGQNAAGKMILVR